MSSTIKALTGLDIQINNETAVSVASNKDVTFAGTIFGNGSGLSGLPPGTETGSIIYMAGNVLPAGFLKANGAALDTTVYADLFAVIGYTFGGSGSSFTLPDLRGEFIRGWDDGRGQDSGRVFGTAQEQNTNKPRIQMTTGVNGGGIITAPDEAGNWSGWVTSGRNDGGSRGIRIALDGTETRPENIALLACIKY